MVWLLTDGRELGHLARICGKTTLQAGGIVYGLRLIDDEAPTVAEWCVLPGAALTRHAGRVARPKFAKASSQ